jgi:FkbM family methyltransferase
VIATKTIQKIADRKIRSHWLVEWMQYELRRSPTLRLGADLFKAQASQIEIDISPDAIIIDCGANIGEMTSLFCRTGATVYAFEPNPLCFKILSNRFFALRSVHCFNQAVMDRDCKMILQTPTPGDGWDALDCTIASSVMPGAHEEPRTEVEVECIDLDRFIQSLGRRVRLVKLDIEGAEVRVLNRLLDSGAIDLIDYIMAETHEKDFADLKVPIGTLRERIEKERLAKKVRLDWIA